MSKKPYYITTAITYTSGKPHIGNTYEIILADSIARYKMEVMSSMMLNHGKIELPMVNMYELLKEQAKSSE